MSGPAGKPRTEAQQIITRLQFSGMKRAEIARQIGVSAETVKAIAAGKSSGDAHLMALRSIHHFAPRAATPPSEGTAPATPPAPTSDAPAVAAPALEVQEAPQDERTAGQKLKDGIKDAILGRGQPLVSAPAKRGSHGGAAGNDELVEQLVPTLALLVVILSTAATPAMYAPCDPTHAEATAMLTPIVRVMTRQLDAVGKLSETQMDILQALMAVGLYGQRAYSTYREITRREGTARNDRSGDQPSAGNEQRQQLGRRGDGQAAPVDARASGAVAAGRPQHSPAPAAPRAQPAGAGRNGHSGDAAGESNPFADIYQLDALGRSQLGIN